MDRCFTAIIFVMMLGLAAILNFSFVANCVEEVIVVEEGESIQEAINRASPGSIIKIMPGKFREQLEINKTLTIIGSGNETVILGSGATVSVKIVRGVTDVILSNLCIDGAGSYKATGLLIQQSNYNKLLNLTIVNFYRGLRIYDSSQSILRNVVLHNNTYNLEVYGLYLSHFLHDIDESNIVNGKRIYYLVNKHNVSLTGDAGYVALVNSTGVKVANMKLSDNFSGLLLAYTNSTEVCNVTCTQNVQGIRLVNSHNITIRECSLISNEWSGISLEPATMCRIYLNTFKFNGHGLYLSFSPYILQMKTMFNKIYLNEFSNNSVAIYVDEVGLNKIYNNNFVENNYAIKVDGASGNLFFHNNFIHNTEDVEILSTAFSNVTNIWDNGYPSGGNFWLKNNGSDKYRGLLQNEEGSDGIMDEPYLVGFNNVDKYPLFSPVTSIIVNQLDENPFEIYGFSKVYNFSFNPSAPPHINFRVMFDAKFNFCRVGMPKNLIWAEADGWKVTLNGSEVEFEVFSSENYTFLCFKLSDSVNGGVIDVKVSGMWAISEYPSIGTVIAIFIGSMVYFKFVKKCLGRSVQKS
jgi:nitrous oxidase accessory protein